MPITVRSVSPHLLVSACRWLLHVCQSVLLWVGLFSELTSEQLVVTIIPSIVVAPKKVKAALPENRPVHMKAVLHSSGQTVEVGDLAVERTLALPILSRRAVLVLPKPLVFIAHLLFQIARLFHGHIVHAKQRNV